MLSLFPALLVFKFRWESLLYLIIYFQLLVIWAQAEIALRQNTLFLTQFEPSFKVSLGKNLELVIENVSQSPAYNVGISRILHKNGKPVPPEKWSNEIEFPDEYPIQCLSPGEKGVLCNFIQPGTLELFIGKEIEVWYTTKIGEDRVIYILPLPGELFLIRHPRRELPGWLLKLFEDLRALITYFRFRKYIQYRGPKGVNK